MRYDIMTKICGKDAVLLVAPLKAAKSLGIFILLKRWGRFLYPELIAPCAIGRNGASRVKTEGDKKTPIGVFDLGIAFGIHDNPNVILDYVKLNDNLYWVDDVNSEYYNKLVDTSEINADFVSAEHMTDYSELYDYGIEIKYNKDCIPKMGSAIFLHCTDDIQKPTSGCVAVTKENMLKILKAITDKENTVIAILDR